MTDFDKYKIHGAYHWDDIDKSSLKKLLSRSIPTLSRYDKLLSAMPNRAKTIVDIGCGDGALTYQLARNKSVRRVIGCDTEARAIVLAKGKIVGLPESHRVTFMNKSLHHCEFEAHSVDAITMCEVIEHLDNPAHMLEEIKRIGKPGGVLAITTPKNKCDGSKWDEHHITEYTEGSLNHLIARYFPSTTVTPFMPVSIYNLRTRLNFFFNVLYSLGLNPLGIKLRNHAHVNLLSISRF